MIGEEGKNWIDGKAETFYFLGEDFKSRTLSNHSRNLYTKLTILNINGESQKRDTESQRVMRLCRHKREVDRFVVPPWIFCVRNEKRIEKRDELGYWDLVVHDSLKLF
jgi:hypothetical protein